MADAELVKSFPFSASHASGPRVLGRNYVFSVAVPALSEEDENRLAETVERELIRKVHTRDLGEHVDFLKGFEKNDAGLLRAFWGALKAPLRPFRPRRLSLQRDSRTVTTLFL